MQTKEDPSPLSTRILTGPADISGRWKKGDFVFSTSDYSVDPRSVCQHVGLCGYFARIFLIVKEYYTTSPWKANKQQSDQDINH